MVLEEREVKFSLFLYVDRADMESRSRPSGLNEGVRVGYSRLDEVICV